MNSAGRSALLANLLPSSLPRLCAAPVPCGQVAAEDSEDGRVAKAGQRTSTASLSLRAAILCHA
jgi:hypothetical protein